jgi:ABC-2 type transport system ATP-binding protein
VAEDTIIYAKGLTKHFGHEEAVQDLTFEIPRGKIFGFIGPSGSGKTTTVRLLTGVYTPTAGEAIVLGDHPTQFKRETRAKIGYMPQLSVLYRDLSVWENLNFAASIYGISLNRGKRLQELLDFVELSAHRRKLVRDLSGGMRRRLSLAATLVHDPELIYLDEPTAGVDPVLRRKFWDHFKELQNQGRTLFITTQYVGEAAYCDLVGVLAEGHLRALDTPEGLRRRAFGGDVVDLYLSEAIDSHCLELLQQQPFFQGHLSRLGDKGLRVIVNEASTAIPQMLNWCEGQDMTVKSVEKYLPPFDDVFVELVKQEPTNE